MYVLLILISCVGAQSTSADSTLLNVPAPATSTVTSTSLTRTTTVATTPTSISEPGISCNSSCYIPAIVGTGLALAVVAALVVYFCRRRRRRQSVGMASAPRGIEAAPGALPTLDPNAQTTDFNRTLTPPSNGPQPVMQTSQSMPTNITAYGQSFPYGTQPAVAIVQNVDQRSLGAPEHQDEVMSEATIEYLARTRHLHQRVQPPVPVQPPPVLYQPPAYFSPHVEAPVVEPSESYLSPQKIARIADWVPPPPITLHRKHDSNGSLRNIPSEWKDTSDPAVVAQIIPGGESMANMEHSSTQLVPLGYLSDGRPVFTVSDNK